MADHPWTMDRLERELRRIMQTRKVRIERHHLGKRKQGDERKVADIEWAEGGEAIIRVDPFQCAMLEAVIHELLHIALESEADAAGELSEPWVLAAEDAVCRRIRRNARSLAWWRDAIDTRIRPPRVED